MELLKSFEKQWNLLNDNEDWKKREDLEIILGKEEKATRSYKIKATGNCCKGDKILFIKRVWEKIIINRFGKKANVVTGYELIEGEIVRESYGREKGQHTFTIKLQNKETLLIKGRNLYAIGVWRKKWENEEERKETLAEKYQRGKLARNVQRYNRVIKGVLL